MAVPSNSLPARLARSLDRPNKAVDKLFVCRHEITVYSSYVAPAPARVNIPGFVTFRCMPPALWTPSDCDCRR